MATKTASTTERVNSKIALAERRIIDVDQDFKWLKALFYGKNGMGKTRLGASGEKVLLVDCNERGSLSVRHFPDVKIFRVETWTDIDLAYWYLHKGNHDRQTVVLDTVTSLAQLCMKFVLGDEASRDPTRDPDMPGKRDWGKVAELMRTVILNFRNLDMNVIFLAQERRGFTDDEDDGPEVFPEVSPSVRTTLTAGVDIIGRMFVKEVVRKDEKGAERTGVEYRMLLGPNERYLTKDRSEAGLPEIVRLGSGTDNLAKLVERIKKGVK